MRKSEEILDEEGGADRLGLRAPSIPDFYYRSGLSLTKSVSVSRPGYNYRFEPAAYSLTINFTVFSC